MPDGAGAHPDAQDAVAAGGQPAEPLSHDDHGTLAHRAHGQHLERGGAGLGEAQQIAIRGDVVLGGPRRIGGQPAGQRLVGRRRLRHGAEIVEADPSLRATGPATLLAGRRDRATAVVLVAGAGVVALHDTPVGRPTLLR